MSTPANAALPLEVAGARKKFGDIEALAGASFDVRPGELLGLLGPNGAGKTTVIKAIAGRVHLDEGTIRVFGRTLTSRDSRPDVGLVPQELAVYPLLTARENLEVFGALYGVSKSELPRRVSWALEWSDLKDRSGEPVKRFSGGMKRRLNIACSLLHDPKLVLLDEPTVGVDPQSRERIYEMLSALRQAGVSIVLTTHHLEEAEQRCDRIVIIDHGRIVAAGTLAELLRNALGDSRSVDVRLQAPWPAASAQPAGWRVSDDGRQVTVEVASLGRDLGSVLGAMNAAGVEVADVTLRGSTLHDAFIALTGRELRE
ncbi:MAG TPA: ABC transporter ATP-binding protein [Vicinamibacterales bacterium]|nr:ABC transporter ATP-binding protein [Vicinamibacterales bacterium]